MEVAQGLDWGRIRAPLFRLLVRREKAVAPVHAAFAFCN
jgi:hypothetical protein